MPRIGGTPKDYRIPIMASRAMAPTLADLHFKLYYQRRNRRMKNILFYIALAFAIAFIAVSLGACSG